MKNITSQNNNPPDRIIYFGDTEEDMNAGKLINAFTVAIAGGSTSRANLQKLQPGLVLSDYNKILERLPFKL